MDGEHNGGVYYSGNLNSYLYCYANPIVFYDPNGMQSKFGTRAWGALRMVGGAAEAVIGGVGGVLTAETGAGAVLGYAVMMHGIDNTITGAKQMWTGETQRSLTQKGITAGAKMLGTNSSTAEQIGDYGDTAIGVFAGGTSSANTLNKVNGTYRVGKTANSSSKSTNAANKNVSPNVQKVLDMIGEFKGQGGTVKSNPLSPTQEVNLTFQKGTQKLDLRIETHPVPQKYGGKGMTPQRHMNVDLYPNKKVLPNNGHKVLE